jgi:Zn-dependent protease/CBS domain-containing protein
MQAHVKLGRVFGIPIGLHYSWLLIAVLLVLSLQAHLHETNPQWGGAAIWVSAVVAGLIFFATLVAHELAHSLVARSRGLPVRSITLFALGGVSQIEKDAPDAQTEFWVAAVGPLSSLMIGVAFVTVSLALGWTPLTTPSSPVLAMLVWLGYVNMALALFNLVPGFPLDGGRILRAIVWWVTGSARRATLIAARVGQFVATGLMVFGILRLFSCAGFGALWIVFIGWFLMQAAGASYSQFEIGDRLRGVRVADAMDRDCPTVDGLTNLQTFSDEYLLRTGRRCFIVLENGAAAGIITLNEVKDVDRARRPYTLVSDVMRPLDQLRTVTPDAPLAAAIEMMTREDLNQLPVVSDGRVEGILSRSKILRLLQNVIELNG